MKKILFIIALAITTISINGQENNLILGVNAGLPLGNLEDSHSSAFGIDISYVKGVSEQIQIGGTTGLIYFLGDGKQSRMYAPIAASFRFNNDEDNFFVGGDFGFAFGITPSGDRGGIYFKPFVGYNVSDNIQLMLAYTGIKKKQPTFGYANLGIAFKL